MKHFLHHKTMHRRNGRIIWANNLGEMDEPATEAEHILADMPWSSNILYEEGEHFILNIFLRDTAQPANLYLGLCSDGTPADGDTLSTLAGEVTGSGYARQAIATTTSGWGAPSAGGSTSTTTSFNASGTWAAADDMFLCDVASGTAGNLIAITDLSTTRTLQNGDQLDCTITLTLE